MALDVLESRMETDAGTLYQLRVVCLRCVKPKQGERTIGRIDASNPASAEFY